MITTKTSTDLLRKNDRGFSFIELLAYMAIAALLILAAVPQFNNYRGAARDAATMNDVKNAAIAVEAYAIDHPGAYFYGSNGWPGAGPVTLAGLNLDLSDGTVLLIADRTWSGWGASASTVFTVPGQAFCIAAFNPDGKKRNTTWAVTRGSYHSGNGGMGVGCGSK